MEATDALIIEAKDAIKILRIRHVLPYRATVNFRGMVTAVSEIVRINTKSVFLIEVDNRLTIVVMQPKFRSWQQQLVIGQSFVFTKLRPTTLSQAFPVQQMVYVPWTESQVMKDDSLHPSHVSLQEWMKRQGLSLPGEEDCDRDAVGMALTDKFSAYQGTVTDVSQAEFKIFELDNAVRLFLCFLPQPLRPKKLQVGDHVRVQNVHRSFDPTTNEEQLFCCMKSSVQLSNKGRKEEGEGEGRQEETSRSRSVPAPLALLQCFAFSRSHALPLVHLSQHISHLTGPHHVHNNNSDRKGGAREILQRLVGCASSSQDGRPARIYLLEFCRHGAFCPLAQTRDEMGADIPRLTQLPEVVTAASDAACRDPALDDKVSNWNYLIHDPALEHQQPLLCWLAVNSSTGRLQLSNRQSATVDVVVVDNHPASMTSRHRCSAACDLRLVPEGRSLSCPLIHPGHLGCLFLVERYAVVVETFSGDGSNRGGDGNGEQRKRTLYLVICSQDCKLVQRRKGSQSGVDNTISSKTKIAHSGSKDKDKASSGHIVETIASRTKSTHCGSKENIENTCRIVEERRKALKDPEVDSCRSFVYITGKRCISTQAMPGLSRSKSQFFVDGYIATLVDSLTQPEDNLSTQDTEKEQFLVGESSRSKTRKGVRGHVDSVCKDLKSSSTSEEKELLSGESCHLKKARKDVIDTVCNQIEASSTSEGKRGDISSASCAVPSTSAQNFVVTQPFCIQNSKENSTSEDKRGPSSTSEDKRGHSSTSEDKRGHSSSTSEGKRGHSSSTSEGKRGHSSSTSEGKRGHSASAVSSPSAPSFELTQRVSLLLEEDQCGLSEVLHPDGLYSLTAPDGGPSLRGPPMDRRLTLALQKAGTPVSLKLSPQVEVDRVFAHRLVDGPKVAGDATSLRSALSNMCGQLSSFRAAVTYHKHQEDSTSRGRWQPPSRDWTLAAVLGPGSSLCVGVRDVEEPSVTSTVYFHTPTLPYPLGLLPGAVVDFHRVDCKISKSKNAYFSFLSVSSLQVLCLHHNTNTKSGQSSHSQAAEGHCRWEDTPTQPLIDLWREPRPLSLFVAGCHLCQFFRVSLKCLCVTCGSLFRETGCSAPSCTNTAQSHLLARLSVLVEDGTGQAVVSVHKGCPSEAAAKLLALSPAQWQDLHTLLQRHGDELFLQKFGDRGSTAVEDLVSLLCDSRRVKRLCWLMLRRPVAYDRGKRDLTDDALPAFQTVKTDDLVLRNINTGETKIDTLCWPYLQLECVDVKEM